MKILFAFMAVIVIGATNANAQCFVRSNIINNGFVQQQQNVFVPQSVVVPQSTAFFSSGNVAFVDQPQFFNQFGQAVVNQPQFINQPQVVQVIERRRGLFGLFGRTRVRTFVQQSAFIQPRIINVGRSRIFIR